MAKKVNAKIPLTDIKCIEKDLTRIHNKIDALNKKINDKIGSKFNTGRPDNDTMVYSECPKTLSYALQDIFYTMVDIEIKIENMESKLKLDGLID